LKSLKIRKMLFSLRNFGSRVLDFPKSIINGSAIRISSSHISLFKSTYSFSSAAASSSFQRLSLSPTNALNNLNHNGLVKTQPSNLMNGFGRLGLFGNLQQFRTLMQPRKTKYKKSFKGRVYGVATRGSVVRFGKYGLQTLSPTRLTAQQIEAVRVVIVRGIRKIGKMWTRVFPDIPATAKPSEVRMGKGKGMIDHYYARVKANKVIFEVDGIQLDAAKALFKVAGSKLPVKSRLVERVIPTTPLASEKAGSTLSSPTFKSLSTSTPAAPPATPTKPISTTATSTSSTTTAQNKSPNSISKPAPK